MDALEKYKNSLKSAWGYNDYNDWPIKYNSIMHLFCKEFAEEFLNEMEQIDSCVLKKGIKDNMNPARIYRMINPIIFGMKKLKIPLTVQRSTVINLLEIVKDLKDGSIFNEDGRNIILPQDRIETLDIKSVSNIDVSVRLHRSIGLLWAYTESIFFRAHDITKEMHGLYPYKNGKLLIREFLNLSPTDLWETDYLIPYNKICIYAVYDKNVDLKIDAYNHFFLERGNFISSLVSYKICVDGEEVDIEALDRIASILTDSIYEIKNDIDKMDWHERALKYADIIWYRKKPISILCGNSGNVPDSVKHNIAVGEIDRKRISALTKREIDFMIKTII